jgi:hypothetical protein
MTTLDDKLLGEKLHNYCSSSSEEDDDLEKEDGKKSTKSNQPKFIPESEIKEREKLNNWSGSATNTGPKGVIKDWQRFKQLEQEKNAEGAKERLALAKKLALTCRSDDLDKELGTSSNQQMPNKEKSIDEDDMDEEFFKEYLKKKIEEMHKNTSNLPRFGRVIELSNESFLNEIDKENKNVKIIIHIYDQKMPECKLMNQCLDDIAKDYAIVKICKINSCEINLSDKFRKMGCPALLIYKNAELIGNFVKMGDEFGDEFCTSDVENFLLEQGYLPSQDLPTIIRSSNEVDNESD